MHFQHAMFIDLVGGNMLKPPGKPPADSVFNTYTGVYMSYSDIHENIDKGRAAAPSAPAAHPSVRGVGARGCIGGQG